MQLSVTNADQEINLETSKEDMMSLFVKSVFGIIPFGSPLGEAISSIIPHQKLERCTDFVHILNHKIKNAERKIEEHELKTQEFTDLLEEGLGQASRALSKERLEYIASLLKNSLTQKDLEHIEKKKLLSILNNLNDVEIIWLKRYSFDNVIGNTERRDFIKKHPLIFKPVYLKKGRGKHVEKEFKEKAFEESYIMNLSNLRLIKNTRLFGEIASNTSLDDVESDKYICSKLGKLLLEYIDFN